MSIIESSRGGRGESGAISSGALGGSSRRDGRAKTGNGRGESICTFWLHRRCFGLDVALVGEVVTLEAIAPVPMAPPAVRGLFNLRGTPVPLVDLASLLELADGRGDGHGGAPADAGAAAEPSRTTSTALVLRNGDLHVGILVDRMESVIDEGRGTFTPKSAADEHPVVRGFLELQEPARRFVTMLDSLALLERLNALRYSKDDEGQ